MIAIDRLITIALFRRGVRRPSLRWDGLARGEEPCLVVACPHLEWRAIWVEGDHPHLEWRVVEVEG